METQHRERRERRRLNIGTTGERRRLNIGKDGERRRLNIGNAGGETETQHRERRGRDGDSTSGMTGGRDGDSTSGMTGGGDGDSTSGTTGERRRLNFGNDGGETETQLRERRGRDGDSTSGTPGGETETQQWERRGTFHSHPRRLNDRPDVWRWKRFSYTQRTRTEEAQNNSAVGLGKVTVHSSECITINRV